MDQVFSENDVIITRRGCIGHITLNRPKSLNALDLDMVRQIATVLEQWREDDGIKAIYMDGTGDRAFCAGGDIKNFYKAGMAYRRGLIDLDTATLFFQEEYELNRLIFHYPKPLIAHMHGITMGGGVGLAGNAQYRIVAPDTKFAMPEAKIGFFPDVGIMYHLKLLDRRIGLYLALTGNVIDANDMLYCGLAEYLLPKGGEDKLFSELQTVLATADTAGAAEVVETVLKAFKPSGGEEGSRLRKNVDAIEKVYSGSCVEGIIEASSACGGMVKDGYDSMLKNSPISMRVANMYYHRQDINRFDDIIAQDLILARNFVRGRDFYEGIRAAVIDKDRAPAWEIRHIDEMSENDLEWYFSA